MRLESQMVTVRRDVASEDLGDEVIVFDSANGEAHLLSSTLAGVWRSADRRTVAELMSRQPGPGADQLVWEALTQLQEKNLLKDALLLPGTPKAGISRRQMLKRLGVAAVAIPTITTILTEQPAAAVCVGAGTACTGNGAGAVAGCCSGRTCTVVTGSLSVCCALRNESCNGGSGSSERPCCSGLTCSSTTGAGTCS